MSRAGDKVPKVNKRGAASGIRKPGTKRSRRGSDSDSDARSNKSMAGMLGQKKTFNTNFMDKINEAKIGAEYGDEEEWNY